MSSPVASMLTSSSLGPASQTFLLMIASLINDFNKVSPPQMWPQDRGPLEKGIHFLYYFCSV